jgi:site-specific DNA-cytosine methylase
MDMQSPCSESCPDACSPTGKTFCEFFAGIGLVREGLAGSGWQCVYANDFDPKKRELYEARFGAGHFHEGDVWITCQKPLILA